jgi:glycosyltransferase involved in cell wall biosynthesis
VSDETALLRRGGHDVRLLDPSVSIGRGVPRASIGVVWDPGRSQEVRKAIRSFRPDVVHVHNVFPALSPAVIRVARRERIPVVMTLHNFRLLCLPATLMRDGHNCEDCVGHLPWRGVIHGCYRDSVAASVPYFASLSLHRKMGTFASVDKFVAVSTLIQEMHARAGLARERISVKPNFAWPSSARRGAGKYFLYLGRLSPEKGVDTLLRAWRPSLGRLVVAGDGPVATALRALPGRSVDFVGQVRAEEGNRLMRAARAVLIPSRCYEGFPRAVAEAYAAGVPVVASRIGGLQEIVDERVTGLFADPYDAVSWTDALERMMDDDLVQAMGTAARRYWTERYTPEHNLRQLESIYEEAIERR